MESLSAEEIAELASHAHMAAASGFRQVTIDTGHGIALLAMASRLVQLEGAISFLNVRGVWQNTRHDGIVQTAKDYGWTGP